MIVRFLIGFMATGLLVVLCSLISYQFLRMEFAEYVGPEPMAGEDSENPAGPVGSPLTEPLDELLPTSQARDTVHAGTVYVLEIYDMEQDQLSEYELNPPGYLVGLDREGLEQYLAEYMGEVPLDEFQKGLVTYDVVSFSGEKVVLRKVYDQTRVPYQYYLVIERGYLVVYYADRKTVCEYTGILAEDLPEAEQVRLTRGIFLKDQSELYGVLQGYSS